MKKIILTLLFILILPCNAQEEIALEDSYVIDESVLDTPFLESEVEKNDIPDISTPPEITTENTKLFDKISKNLKDVYELQIESNDVPSCLLKEQLTHKFKKGPIESIHYWTGLKFNIAETIEKNDSDTNFNIGFVNLFLDGKFKGGKENFRIMLDPTHRNNHEFMQYLFQDVYIDSQRIPHHRILVGNSRPGVGHEGASSSYTLPLASRSQIARNFGTARKLGVRVMGNYSLVDYDLGGYSSGTYFTDFFPGGEFDGWVNIKPLGKTNGKYGKLTLGGGITAGSRNSKDFLVSSAYIGYEYKKLWFKAEYANADGSNGYTGFSSKKRQGWNATVGYRINKKLELIARYDEFDPDKKISHNNIREYTAGITYYIKAQALKVFLNYVFCQNSSSTDSHRIILGTQIAL